MKKIVIVTSPKHWTLDVPGIEVISAKDYLTDPQFTALRNVRVFNLCRDYSYQSKGYYVSLLAEARGHKAVPNVKNIQDLKAPAIVKIVSDDLDALIQRSLKRLTSRDFVLSIYFGGNIAKQYQELAEELHRLFQAPFLRAKFAYRDNKWFIQGIKTISLDEIPESHLPSVNDFARAYFDKRRYIPARQTRTIYDLAILVNPEDKAPPSCKKAIQKFIDAAEEVGFSVELVTRKDYHRIAEFDALFIRETTGVNHHTYRFARRAQSEGLVVIDDPDSILRCSNKVYLQELMSVGRIPSPRTLIVHSENKRLVSTLLGLPCVLKLPDSSFSHGVTKAMNREELQKKLDNMLDESDLVIAQEYVPTDYDWRIGVLDGRVLFACQYFMAKGHWQVYNWGSEDKKAVSGHYKSVHLEEVPDKVLKVALKVTSLIGRGLYGVDIKLINGRAVVIEVNDNPNIDEDVEDQVYGMEIYRSIMKLMRRRIEARMSNLRNPLRVTREVASASGSDQ